jgi:hypothetical protein
MADYGVDLLIDGEWTPVSVRENDGVTITGGRQEDAGESDPLQVETTLIDYDGDLNPRNVRGQHFGKLGQGMPLRVTRPAAETHLWIADTSSGAATPDVAALDTADLDVRIDIQAVSWLADAGITLCAKYDTTGNQRSWIVVLSETGEPWIRWSPDGTLASAVEVYANAKPVYDEEGRVTLRFYLDVDNGSGQYVVRFYQSHDGVDAPGGWTQIGSGFVGPASSIFNGTAPVRVGHSALTASNVPARVFGFQQRATIGGTVVANPDFTAATPGASSLVDSTGKTWTLYGAADFRDIDVRATVELQKYPPRWTVTETFKWARVLGQGLSQRLKRPAARLRSPLYREATAAENLARIIHYWSFEDGSSSTQAADSIDGGVPLQVFGEPSFASSSRIPGSDPLLAMSDGVTATAVIPSYTSTGTLSFRFVADVPATGWEGVDSGSGSDGVLLEFQVSGSSVRYWRLELTSLGGQIALHGYAPDGALLADGSNINYDMLGRRGMIGLNMTQNGTAVDWSTFVRYIEDDLTVTELGFNSTFTSRTLGTLTRVTVAPNANLDGGAFGHLMVGTSTSLAAGIDTAIVGNNGETAAAQLTRLGLELGVEVRILGRAEDTSPMSPQPSGTPWELFQRCADTDGGILYESRDRLAVEYRSRFALYNGPAIPITYDQPGESPDLEPDEPGADLTNIYTASRPGGSEYTARQVDGPLSIAAFPDGAGPMDGGDDFSTQLDSDLHDAAWWAIHLSTWDEYRYPVVTFNVEKLARANPKLARAVRNALPGDRFVISNPPGDLPPWPIDVMVQGFAETYRTSVFEESFNTTPGRPWQVGVAGVDPAESDGTTLTADITAGQTTFQWDVVGEPWAEDSAYPLMMVFLRDGREMERFEVTDIVGTGSTQDVTSTRGTDGGWATDHPAGTVVKLWQPVRFAR